MAFTTPPFIHLGIDARTGKAYHICSRKALLSLTVILALVVSMASERLLFKVMVDRMESYRYFLCQLMTFLYIPPLFCIAGYRSPPDEFIEEEMTEFPKFHFFIMGILDLLHAMMIFVAGGRTDPTQTLLFMQASIPLSTIVCSLAFGVKYSRLQIIGALAITGGIVISLFPSLEDVGSDDLIDQETGWSSVMYLLAAIPGALSMIYKERAIRDQPMDMVYLNAWVSVNQFVAGLLVAPIVFDLEFLHLDQKMSGLQCLLEGKSEAETDDCYLGLPILLMYITANVAINMLMLQLLKLTNVSTMYGATLVGFFASFAVLAWYQTDPSELDRQHNRSGLRDWIPPSVFIDVLAFLVLFAGKVLYQWDPDPEIEATTLSAEDKEAASLLNGDDDYGLRYT